MVHGNPTWSIYFRGLGAGFATAIGIVPDHIGCGLSEKPGDERYEYTLASRVDDLEALLDSLGLEKDPTLVLHDWGGMIGMAYAARHPERVKQICHPQHRVFRFAEMARPSWSLRLSSTRSGAFLIRGLNAFAAGPRASAPSAVP